MKKMLIVILCGFTLVVSTFAETSNNYTENAKRIYLESKENSYSAITELNKALAINKKDEKALLYKALIYRENNDYENAVLTWKKLIKLDKTNIYYQWYYGIDFYNYNVGGCTTAYKVFKKLSNKYPNNPDLLYNYETAKKIKNIVVPKLIGAASTGMIGAAVSSSSTMTSIRNEVSSYSLKEPEINFWEEK